MKKDLISRMTRRHFREWLVGSTLREIADLFTSHGFEKAFIPPDLLPSGERRTSVECFYESVDWTEPEHISRMLRLYEDIIFKIEDRSLPCVAELFRYLERDGYVMEGNSLVVKGGGHGISPAQIASFGSEHLAEHIHRIERSIADDPAQAIGSAKELIESTLKTIIEGMDISYASDDDIPKLLKATQAALELAPSGVHAEKRGADIIKRTLSNLSSVAIGVAELRNLYGTGHGKGRSYKGLSVRHARLAVSSSAALCMFLLETYEARTQQREKQ
jgi:hypothetical protein